MAGRSRGKTRPKKRVPRSKRQLRLLWLVALLAATAYFYYQPLSSYFETRGELEARRAEVENLQIVRADLEGRLQSSTSLEATKREARRIGYVLPGEQLFVIKGIPEWRRTQRNLTRDG
ncbi:MAG: septum formation initiator family protein [Gaiellaceae bacterium]